MKDVVSKIVNLYNISHSFGYAHLVFDDGNISNGQIEWCLNECRREVVYKYGNKEVIKRSVIALNAFRWLDKKDRNKAIDLAFDIIYGKEK